VWKSVLLKSSNFNTLMAWWSRYVRPDNEQNESFLDIWVTWEEIEAIENSDAVERRLVGSYPRIQLLEEIERRIGFLLKIVVDGAYSQGSNISIKYKNADNSNLVNNYVYHAKDYSDMYKELILYERYRVDDISNNIWNTSVSALKRKNYPNMQTERNKHQKLKRHIPKDLLEKFTDEEEEKMLKVISSNDYSYNNYLIMQLIKNQRYSTDINALRTALRDVEL